MTTARFCRAPFHLHTKVTGDVVLCHNSLYKIFGGRWSMTLFRRSFRARGRQFFDIFHNVVNVIFLFVSRLIRAWTKMKWRSIFEKRVTPEIRCSALSCQALRGEGNLETPKVGCWQLRITPRTPRAIRSDTAEAAGILNKDVTLTSERFTWISLAIPRAAQFITRFLFSFPPPFFYSTNFK